MRTVLPTVLGAALILAALRDILHELFHPEGSGSISRLVMHGVWQLARPVGRRFRALLHMAGPLALVATALTWTVMVALGFALVYWPRLPAGFNVAPSLPPFAERGFAPALFVSLANLSGVGAGDFPPLTMATRLLTTAEAFIGLVIITAWITWVLSTFPVLAGRRAFMRQVSLLRRTQADPAALVADSPREAIVELLRSLTEQLLRTGSDLLQTRVTYYFRSQHEELLLARQMPWILALAREAEGHGEEPALRHQGASLRRATESLLGDIGEQFLGLEDAPPERVLEAFARDHLVDPRADAGG